MAVCWKRYFTDKLKCGRGRQISYHFTLLSVKTC